MKYKYAKIGTYKSTKELIPGLEKAISKSASTMKVKKKHKKY